MVCGKVTLLSWCLYLHIHAIKLLHWALSAWFKSNIILFFVQMALKGLQRELKFSKSFSCLEIYGIYYSAETMFFSLSLFIHFCV